MEIRSEIDTLFKVTTTEEYISRYINTDDEIAIKKFKLTKYEVYEMLSQIIALELSIYTLGRIFNMESNVAALKNLRNELINDLRERHEHIYKYYNDNVLF